ncbi:MAG: AAA family ATPase [Gammaproteobacteria bacterium]
MITPELGDSLYAARRDAMRRGFAELTLDHLAMVLTNDAIVRPFFETEGTDVPRLREKLLQSCLRGSPRLKAEDGKTKTKKTMPDLNDSLWALMARARKTYGHVTGLHILVESFAEGKSMTAYYLKKSGVERMAILAYLAKHPPKIDPPEDDDDEDEKKAKEEADAKEKEITKNDWVEKARSGALEKPVGRDGEVVALLRILMRKYRRNPLLVGKPGVGKTAVVRALAHRFALRKSTLSRIVPLSMNDMIAGTRYRGDFEQRMRDLCEVCRRRPGIILFIDDIHTLIGAGAASGALDAAGILKPMMDDNAVQCIGATTESEYSRIFSKDAALTRRFQKVVVAEPEGDALDDILEGIAARLEDHHSVRYSAEAIDASVHLSRRFLPGRFLPDKAIDMLDDAGSRRRTDDDDYPVSADDVAGAVADCAGLPLAVVREDDKARLARLEEHLGERVVEQPEAVRRLCGAVLRARLGYHDGGRTAGAFLFAGPTGVGKTEMARQLADLLALPLLRYDMSEYMEAHSAAKLIGAPPGYVGFEERGRLTEDIAANPAAVVLFDEVDKAHPDVLSLMLQIMDYASLSDSGGRRADFSNALIILTSNAGAREYQGGSAGFERGDNKAAAAEALKRFHTPEFRNRLDAIVHFKPLSAAAIGKILSRRLQKITADIAKRKGLRLTITPQMRRHLTTDGFSPTMGARPLERLLRERIFEPLAQAEAMSSLPKECQIDWHNQTAIIIAAPAKKAKKESTKRAKAPAKTGTKADAKTAKKTKIPEPATSG